MKKLVLIITLISITINAQVGIGTTSPNGKSELEISSNSKGILIPRMTELQRTAINPTATEKGLLVYQTNNTSGFYFFNGTIWLLLIENTSLNNYWSKTGNATTNPAIHFVGTTDNQDLVFRTNNQEKIRITAKGQIEVFNTGTSVFIGENAGENDDLTNNDNVFIGTNSGQTNTTGANNVAIGDQSLVNNLDGISNVVIGTQAMFQNTSGNFNVVLGVGALDKNTSQSEEVAVGALALTNKETGEGNTILGTRAGLKDVNSERNTYIGYHSGGGESIGPIENKTDNVFVGYKSGFDENGSNKLYIENTDSTTPLIYGEFDNNILRIYGKFQIGNPLSSGYAFPTVDGSVNQILQTDGNGQLAFANPSSLSITNASNGLNSNSGTVKLGGTLIEDTTINYGIYDTRLNLNGTGDFIIQDNGTGVFQIADNGETTFGDDTIWRDLNTTGTIIAKLYDNIDSGIFDVYGSGSVKNRIRGNGDSFFNGGDVGFGKTNPAYQVDISETTAAKTRALSINKSDTGASDSWAIYNTITGTGTGKKYGVFNQINSTANGSQYGTRNWLRGSTAGGQFGVFNNLINNSTGDQYGVYNGMRNSGNANQVRGVHNEFNTTGTVDEMSGIRNQMSNGTPGATGMQGVYNYFTNAENGNYYGNRSEFTNSATGTGNKYGTHNFISGSANGTHYGTYNNVSTAKGWAGYFIGNSYFSNNVGINTDSPDYRLSVKGVTNLNEDTASGVALRVNSFEALWFDGTRFSWGFGGTSNTFANDLGIGMTTAPSYRLDVRKSSSNNYISQIYNNSVNSNADALKIRIHRNNTNSNNLFIGFHKSDDSLIGSISGNTSASISFNTTSDRRLKQHINDIDNALELINKIQPRIYEFISNPNVKENGFIAQELQKVYPQAVVGSPDSDVKTNPMMVDYSKLTPILVAGIKELNTKIKNLEAENINLKVKLLKIDALETRLNEFENKQNNLEIIEVNKN